MLINTANLASLNTGFNASFNSGFGAVDPIYSSICMMAKSSGKDEVYAWLGQLPGIREWLGPRIVNKLEVEGYRIENRTFESTVEVKRTDIEDDRIGVLSPMFEDLGRRAAEFPDELFAELIADGFTSTCYDGQYFFDTDHPVASEPGGAVQSVSNFGGGSGEAWYLLDLSRSIRPFIYQERIPFTLQRRDQDGDSNVFEEDTYQYGVRGRCNVGFGLWQLAYASKQALTPENYETARAAMSRLRGDNGKLLGVKPTHLLVPVALEGHGRRLLKNQNDAAGASNPWIDSAELMVSPWLG
ncbi:MAG: Mu-like prophage major head subunit gpT family protein [Erythrobacter sp.]|nr:Mu-like prophage major head subunit gpT family protein [Erythrobacter sp.]